MCESIEACELEAMTIVLNRMAEDTPEEVRRDACTCRAHHLTQLGHMLCLVDVKAMC